MALPPLCCRRRLCELGCRAGLRRRCAGTALCVPVACPPTALPLQPSPPAPPAALFALPCRMIENDGDYERINRVAERLDHVVREDALIMKVCLC